MSQTIYSDCNISIDEHNAEILINPKGECFYFIPCDSQSGVFSDSALNFEEDDKYSIEGTQRLRTKYSGGAQC